MILAERTRLASDVANELLELQLQIDRLQVQACRLASELAESRLWEQEGSNSAIDWIRFNCHLTDKAAGDRVVVGELLPHPEKSVQALESGQIGYAHLTVMARTAKAV